MVMPLLNRRFVTLSVDHLLELGRRILGAEKLAVPTELVDLVVRPLVQSDIEGYESHGIVRLRRYTDYVLTGRINPQASLSVLKDQRGVAHLDGCWQFGQVTMQRTVEYIQQRMGEFAAFTVLVRGANHIGRLSYYVRQLAEAGYIARMEANAMGRPTVTIHGANQPRVGTEPLAVAVPLGKGRDPLVYDASTAAIVEGNVYIARTSGVQLPPGYLLDKHGQPTTDPMVIYLKPGEPESERGSVLPMGGISQGYRGSGMSIMMNAISGILSGSGVNPAPGTPGTNGTWLYCLDPREFMDADEYAAQCRQFVDYLQSARPIGDEPIRMPGAGSAQRRDSARQLGAQLDVEVYQDLCELAADLGVSVAGIDVSPSASAR